MKQEESKYICDDCIYCSETAINHFNCKHTKYRRTSESRACEQIVLKEGYYEQLAKANRLV